ncbi:low temperature requirement protein A [Marinobacter arenosus]|uniref:low temperature requirement protein A n=1 Tax=Marinobacter arenosus TaxID=2856822 RepID=UPI001C4B7BF4|nr:low temperature requirement protein A [Marinobacter arenosus]MBW0147356.1 low temperature requirement protein A [Marinobacter arenosus]
MAGFKSYIASSLSALSPRDSNAAHRQATPLELFYDLVSVIAIAAAAAGLHHSISEAHVLEGLVKYFAAFFCIWWAWMNHTWFASAYDNDDALYRVLTFVIMTGALIMAAGIREIFTETEFILVLIGFIIMRLAMVMLWVRAALNDIERRVAAIIYAVGIAMAQLYWITIVVFQSDLGSLFFPLFYLGMLVELAVPVIAERTSKTPWHREHIVERYGLLNIIVLGETVLAVSIAISLADSGQYSLKMLNVVIPCLIILYSMWWLYFSWEGHLKDSSVKMAIVWGYGHFLIYSAGAAVGAGMAAYIDFVGNNSAMNQVATTLSVSIPVSLYFFGLWFVRDRLVFSGIKRHILLLFGLISLLASFGPGLYGIALCTLAAVVARGFVYHLSLAPSE